MKQIYKCITDNVPLKIISLLASFVLWNIYVRTIFVEKTVHIPVYVYNAPDNITCDSPETIEITLSGKQSIMRTIEHKSMLLQVNAAHCTNPINWIPVTESDISMPHDIRMVHAYPSMITIRTQHITT